MALTLRLTKGSPLSHQELDDNFTYLSGSLTDSNTLLSGSFPADRLIVSADSASATAGGVTTNSQLRTYDGNTSILIGGSQGSFGVTGLGMLIKEDEGSGDHVILSDGSGSNLRLRVGGGDVGDSYVMIQADQAGFSDDDIFVVAKFGGPNKGTELYHSGSLVFFTDELSGDKSVYISGSLSGSKDVFFPALPNTTTPHIVGFDSASGQLTYYSTASFGGGSSTNTGSLMLTGSVSNNTLTFTKGDGSTFSLTVDTGSGAGGGSTDYVSNVVLNGTDLEFTGTGNAFNSAVDLSSLSGGGSTDTGSLMLTGSVTNNVLTFTKGDGTTFDLTVDTGSAGGGSIGSLQQVTDVGNVTTNTIFVNKLFAQGAITGSTLGVNTYPTNAQFEVDGDSWLAGRLHLPKLKTLTTNLKLVAIQTGSAQPNFGELTTLDLSTFLTGANTGSFVYSGSFDGASSVVTLYSKDLNYDLDLSGLAGGGGGFPVTASDEGVDLTNSMSKIDFVGNAVTATNVGSIVTVTINTGSAAAATDITDLNNFTGSIQTEVDSLTAATSSYLTGADTGSFVYSGSFDGSTTLTLYSEDNNYSLDLSALAGGGTPTDITALNNFTGSIQTEVDSLTAATSSYLTGADTGSFYISSSVVDSTITFTQGDGTTESVTVNNVGNATSASYAPNLFNTNGSLTANRTLDFSGNSLTFDLISGNESFSIAAENNATIGIGLDNSELQITGLASATTPNLLGIDSFGKVKLVSTASLSASYAATASYAYETDVTYATSDTSQTTARAVHVAGTANAVNGTSTTTSPVMSVLSGKTLGQDAFFTATWIDNSVAGQQARPIAIETISGSNQLVFTVDTMNADVQEAIMFQGIVFV